jgi:hypothetical protein
MTAGLEVDAGLAVQVGALTTALQQEYQRRQSLQNALHQVTVGPGQIPLSAGAGTLQQDPMMGPNTGYFWSVRRLSAWGFTAGTVQVYMNQPGGELLPSFPAAGSLTFGRGEVLLQPLDNLVFVASGITGTVQVQGIADNGELWILADYLL